MKHYRDAATGKYFSAEEAETRDKATYVVEEDKDTDNKALLESLFADIIKQTEFSYRLSEGFVPVKSLREVFRKYGIENEGR